ncbi:LamG-like jellyroll fold domain-containing protein [Neptunicella sp. SCSIO 80796]|uniref:LamG-like jellyroll fold domain-containing protein n=1 Tax=Neptunicella plasticusilytica TaxID=3117012 RepID=UPI003A4D90B0
MQHPSRFIAGLMLLTFALSAMSATPLCEVPVEERGSCLPDLSSLDLNNKNVHLILTIGNSHNIGRTGNNQDQSFGSKVLQWNHCGSLSRPSGVFKAMLDHVDPVAGGGKAKGKTDRLSPDLTFSEDYLAEYPAVDYLIFVPSAKGGTGFVDPDDPDDQSGNWSADQSSIQSTAVCSRLDEAVIRYNNAAAYLSGQGANITHAGTLFHNANPDYNPSVLRWGDTDDAYSEIWDNHQQQIDYFIDYLRDNLDGYQSTTPIVIGGGMIDTQFQGRPTNDALFQANLNGAHIRQNYVGTYDPIHFRNGDFISGKLTSDDLPIGSYDGTHTNSNGERTKGHLRFRAWQRASNNSDHLAPFGQLSFISDLTAYWDFRSGTPLDFSGNHYDLSRYRGEQSVNRPPLYAFDGDLEDLVWRRTSTSTYRVHQLPMPLPASYTIAVFVKPAQFTEPMAFLQQAGGPVNYQHRFQYSAANDQIRAGHGAISTSVAFSASALDTDHYFLLTLSYDASTQEMKLGLDGVVQDTASNVANHQSQTGSFLGAANDDADNPLIGRMVFAMIVDRAISDTELGELWNKTQQLNVHKTSQ